MTGKGNVSEVSDITHRKHCGAYTAQRLQTQNGTGIKFGGSRGSADARVVSPGAQRHPTPSLYKGRNVVSRTRSLGRCKAEVLGVAQPQGRGMAVPVKDAGGSERSAVMDEIGVLPHTERRLTFRGCDRTKNLRQTVNRGSVYNA